VKFLANFFGRFVKPDKTPIRRVVRQIADDQSQDYVTFIATARKAGFTGPQADFMWAYLSRNSHQHEYVVKRSISLTGEILKEIRDVSGPPIVKVQKKKEEDWV